MEKAVKRSQPLTGQNDPGICHSYRPENYANREHGDHLVMSKVGHMFRTTALCLAVNT